MVLAFIQLLNYCYHYHSLWLKGNIFIISVIYVESLLSQIEELWIVQKELYSFFKPMDQFIKMFAKDLVNNEKKDPIEGKKPKLGTIVL